MNKNDKWTYKWTKKDWITQLKKSIYQMLQYTDIESCKGVALTEDQLKRYENDVEQLRLPAEVIYKISGTLRKVVSGFYNKETGNTVCIHYKVVEELIRVDPTFFDGVNINIGEPLTEGES